MKQSVKSVIYKRVGCCWCRVRSHAAVKQSCQAEREKCDTQTGGLLSGKRPCSCEAEL